MPCVAVTFTDHHRRHDINHFDFCTDVTHEHNINRPVEHDDSCRHGDLTISDLLDDYALAVRAGDFRLFDAVLRDLNSGEVDSDSFFRLVRALYPPSRHLTRARLSPSERAEFDRRTT